MGRGQALSLALLEGLLFHPLRELGCLVHAFGMWQSQSKALGFSIESAQLALSVVQLLV